MGLLWKGVKLGFRLPLKELEGRVREKPQGLPMGKSAGFLCTPAPAPLTPLTPKYGHSLEHLQNQQLSKSFVAAQPEDQCFSPCSPCLSSTSLAWHKGRNERT